MDHEEMVSADKAPPGSFPDLYNRLKPHFGGLIAFVMAVAILTFSYAAIFGTLFTILGVVLAISWKAVLFGWDLGHIMIGYLW